MAGTVSCIDKKLAFVWHQQNVDRTLSKSGLLLAIAQFISQMINQMIK